MISSVSLRGYLRHGVGLGKNPQKLHHPNLFPAKLTRIGSIFGKHQQKRAEQKNWWLFYGYRSVQRKSHPHLKQNQLFCRN